ncbi:MAG: hypothetical protein IJY61_08370 [Candidatus Gastranaerophilales bacterium]|nr:hypothetical protein [Candidatus Gastranaerophilales bacterium]
MSYELIKLNTARNALRYVINAFDIKELYLPYYICPTLRSAINKENCKIIFYHIDKTFKPLQDFPHEAFILHPNYFGVCCEIVNELSLKYQNLIVDNAHSFYSEPKGIASFNSLRKFFPILRNGSFLYTKRTLDIDIEKDAYTYEPKILTYEEICKNENRLDTEEIKYISETTLNSLPNPDREKRIEKFYYWQNRLNGKIKLTRDDVPFVYPYLAATQEEANKLVNELEKENITIYRYWNNLPDSYSEKIFYTNLVVIPLNTFE